MKAYPRWASVVLFIAALFSTTITPALTVNCAPIGLGSWVPIGPFGESVLTLAIDSQNPNTMYAGTNSNGVFKSTDGGANWGAVNTGLGNLSVPALVLDPSNPNTVYAGTYGGGVFKSTDGGASWSAVNVGLSGFGLYAHTLALDPTNPNTVYAGTDVGIEKSIDGGANWSATNFQTVWTLALDPTNPNTVYAGTPGAGIYKSTDGGASWSAVNTGSGNLVVSALVLDPTNPSTVYAGTYAGGVFKSTDGGANWSAVNAGLSGLNLYVPALALDPSNPNTAYAGTARGIYKSTDGGANWSAINTGMGIVEVFALALDPTNPNILYAGTSSGVYKYEVSNALKRPVVIIPGIEGTELYHAPSYTEPSTCTSNCTEVWLPAWPLISDSFADSFLFPLLLKSDGITTDTNRYCAGSEVIAGSAKSCATNFDCPYPQPCTTGGAADIEPEGPLTLGPYDAYTELSDYLGQHGYTEGMNLFTYGFDWRLDLAGEAARLHAFLSNTKYFPDQSLEVDVIAHSMGGLLVRAYLKQYPNDQRIHSIIYLGTPQHGAPKAYAILKGTTSLVAKVGDIPYLNLNTETFVAQHFPGVYELLPRFNFIGAKSGGEPFSYDESIQASFSTLSTQNLVTKANNLYDSGLAGPDSGPQSFAINGTAHETLRGFDFTNPQCPKSTVDLCGDGTVPTDGLCGGATVPGDSFGPFVSAGAEWYVNDDHKDLPGNPYVQQKILDILGGQNNLPVPCVDNPVALCVFSSPVAGADAWRWSSCSPIRTHITDTAGDTDGLDSNGNLHEEIPDSTQLRFTENEGGFMPFNQTYTVNIAATDNGLFTLAFDHVASPNANIIASTTYKGIPISAQSRAWLTLSPTNTAPDLNLDVDGDGVVDFTIPANAAPSASVFSAVLINVVQNLDLPEGIRTSLLAKLVAVAASMERGNQDAARGQLEAFLNEVSAQRGKTLSDKQADTLTTLAAAELQSP